MTLNRFNSSQEIFTVEDIVSSFVLTTENHNPPRRIVNQHYVLDDDQCISPKEEKITLIKFQYVEGQEDNYPFGFTLGDNQYLFSDLVNQKGSRDPFKALDNVLLKIKILKYL